MRGFGEHHQEWTWSCVQGSRGVFWSFALFLGWLLSFPLHGPLLTVLASLRGGNETALGLSFTLFHGVGLAVFGLVLPMRHWRQAMESGSLACLLLSGLAYWSAGSLLVVWMGALGLAAALFIVGWSHPYVAMTAGNRVEFMAALTFAANAFLYALNAVAGTLPFGLMFLAVNMLLVASYSLSRGQPVPETKPAGPVGAGFPVALLCIFCLLILGLYINGGLLYNLIYPTFQRFRHLDRYYQLVPYLATLALIWRFGGQKNQRFTLYAGVTLLGLGFVSFGLLPSSRTGYFITETLILSAFALLDVFVWTLLAEISELHGHTFRVFGLGLAVNVLALFLGGVSGERLGRAGPEYPLLTGLLASGAVFATLALLPVMDHRAAKDLQRRIREERSAPAEANPTLDPENTLPGAGSLTGRELEIVRLIIGGATNAEIAAKLYISENTVKVHIKNINRKLGVANKYELLVALIKAQAKPGSRIRT